ncbi:Response regulator receiver domain-containing protein [Lachnospiraceae bacterium NLAE-zl-G231]|nr:Response regulator receiver domain-containing protein [Lachnospiraceae bacterium NLAE-zl-G231]
MLFAAVDPNKKDLKQLVKFLKSAYPGCKIVMFCNPLTAAGYVRSHPVDVLFTEIAMTGMSGFRLKEITEKCNPGALTIFISATAAYAMDALNCRVFDYMVKPVTPEKTRNALKETKFQPFIQKN